METWLTEEAARSLESVYGFRIRAVVPMRSVVGIMTDQGRFICKRYDREKGLSYDHLLGIVVVKEALSRYGLVKPYLSTGSKQPLFVWKNAPVTVEPWLKGRHADFRNQSERIQSVQAVARLHRIHVKVPDPLFPNTTVLQKLSNRLQKATQVVARGGLSGITEKEWEMWLTRSARSLRALSDARWENFFREDKKHGILCHRDLAPHNILIERGSPASLIDFDLAGIDSPVYDLFQLFDHVAYRAFPPRGWELEMLNAYGKIFPLSSLQIQALNQLRSFPSLLLREIADLDQVKNERARERLGTRIRYARNLEEERSFAIP